MLLFVAKTVAYSREELLRERREGAVRAIIRGVGYALARGYAAEDFGRFLHDSDLLAGIHQRQVTAHGQENAPAFAAWHMAHRWGCCGAVTVRAELGGLVVESESLLEGQEEVLGYHGVTPADIEACLETYWRLSGEPQGLLVSYTLGENQDWALIRPQSGPAVDLDAVEAPRMAPDQLAAHRRIALATGITCAIGFAKSIRDEPEELGHFFYQVWEHSGHYERLGHRLGFGNALAYAQTIAQSRQILYRATELTEDLDGYTIASPSWASEIPQVLGRYGCLPEDIYRYYLGGGLAACSRLGLQYADQSDDRVHRVWIRAR